jgi:hypothetical protein
MMQNIYKQAKIENYKTSKDKKIAKHLQANKKRIL